MWLIAGIISHALAAGTGSAAELKSKPGWFWNQPADCGHTAVGISRHSALYPENSKKQAINNALHNYLRQQQARYSGGQAFSITERGGVWLGDDIQEQYDTTGHHQLMEELPRLDYKISGNISLILIGPEECQDEADRKGRPVTEPGRPEWVDHLPSHSGYLFGIGVSPGYYYADSSWKEAEKTARINLAESIQSTVKGLHDQQTGISAEVIASEISVTLVNAVVVSRYHDPGTDLYYVLIRMPA